MSARDAWDGLVVEAGAVGRRALGAPRVVVRAAAAAGGGYAAFGDFGQILAGEGRTGWACVVGVTVLCTGGAATVAGGGDGLGFFADLDESLGVLVCDSFLVLALHLGFLLVVCIFGIFEDVDEMFSLFMSVCMHVKRGGFKLTVLTTFPDLLMIVTVSITGILTLYSRNIKVKVFEVQLRGGYMVEVVKS